MPAVQRQNSLNVLDDDDSASQTSFAASSMNTAIRVPALPREAREKEFFECPLCFMIVSIHTKAGWKYVVIISLARGMLTTTRQHVYRDLHPYCCTFDNCNTSDRLYDSRHEWFQHELKAHRTSWQCIEACGKTFAAESEFETHVRRDHTDIANMLSALRRTSAKSASLTDAVECVLCQKKMSLRGLQKHLASHQQQLALFALPPNLDDTEDDKNEDEDGTSEIKASEDEEDLSDISDSQDDDENHEEDEADDDFATTHTPGDVQRDFANENIFDTSLLRTPGSPETADDDVDLGPLTPSRATKFLASPTDSSQDESQDGITEDDPHLTDSIDEQNLKLHEGAKGKKKNMWTEVAKDLVLEEAIIESGYAYDESRDFFYIKEYLQYASIFHAQQYVVY
jgi:hypothetical protein